MLLGNTAKRKALIADKVKMLRRFLRSSKMKKLSRERARQRILVITAVAG
jgi:hypothetical protein